MKIKTLSAAVGGALLSLGGAASGQMVAPSGSATIGPSGTAAAPAVPPTTPPNPYALEASGIPSTGQYAPAGIRLSDTGIFVTPTLSITLGHNDNLRTTSRNRISSGFAIVTPEVQAQTAYRANRFTLGYRADVIRYFSSSADNIENQQVSATGSHPLTTRFGFDWRALFQDRYDPLGSTLRSVGSTTPDNWHGTTLAGIARYGAPGARGRIEVELGGFSKEYQNNRANTAGADFDSVNFSTRLYTRVAPNTELLTEYRNTQFDYKVDANNLDNTEHRLLFGALWRATAKTSGQFKAGYLKKDFDRVRPSYSGATWEGGFRWEPLTYSTVDFATGRSTLDPSGTGTSFILSTFVNAGWTHKWKSFFSTRVFYAHANEEYRGLGREDRTNTLGIQAAYDVRRNARASVGFERTVRDSNTPTFSYHRNVATARLELAF